MRTMLSSLMSPSWTREKTSSRLTLRALRRASGLGLEAVGALLRELAGAAVVLDRLDVFPRLADPVEAEHLDRHARPRRSRPGHP